MAGKQRAGAPAGPATAGDGARIRVTWVRSEIGHTAATRGTIRALGLHRLHQTVELADTPVNRGMIRRVAFLLEVTEVGAAAKNKEAHAS